MMLHEDAEGLIHDLPRIIDRVFALEGVVLYVCDRDQFFASTSDLPMSIRVSLHAMTQGPNPRWSCRALYRECADAGFAAGGALGWRRRGFREKLPQP